MTNVDRSLTLPSEARTLWVHWGRTGGGPRFLADLVDGDLNREPLQVGPADQPVRASATSAASQTAYPQSYLSYNPDAEIAPRFAAQARGGVPAFPVPTYNSTAGVVYGLPRLLWNSLRLRRWIRRHRIDRVVCVMESVYQSLALPVLVPGDVEYVACIHDGSAHPGEGSVVQSVGRRNELRRADRVVTFSEAVTSILADRVDVPITTGDHPPFDLADAATQPRELPDTGADTDADTDGAPRVPVIGLFGRLQKYKGIDVALAAMRILRERGAPECELRIIGSGPEERLRDTDLGGYATWDNRWIPEEEVTEVVRGFDIMLLPYTEASQSGPVTLALAHAVPCVATPVGAIPDQVDGFGVVTDDVSPEAVADGIESLLTDPALYRALSSGAIRRVAEQPDWSDLADLIRRGQREPSAELPSAPVPSPEPVPSPAQRLVSRAKWAGQRVFGVVNTHRPLPRARPAAHAGTGRVRVVLPASHGSFGDEAMGLVAAASLRELLDDAAVGTATGTGVDLVVPGDAEPWRRLVPEGVDVLPLGGLTAGRGTVPTATTVRELASGPLVVIGADTLAGDYELALLATRVRMLNVAAAAGHAAALVNFSLPATVHPAAARILRRLDRSVVVRARDALSARRAADILGREVPCTPDIAALLEPAPGTGRPVEDGVRKAPVVFVPNAHLGGMYGVGTDHLVTLWQELGRRMREQGDGRPVEVVVHDVRDSVGDVELGRRIVGALAEVGVDATMTVPATAAEAKAAIAAAAYCVSARMHACVAALSSGVPTVGIGYVGKFSGQFDWYGDLGSVLEYSPDLTADEILERVAIVRGGAVTTRASVVDLVRGDYGALVGAAAR
ncbi:glycosyltransferase [Corynebacterium sp.]|uniref:glycosyltransferase n=1 Tax=Corynebacterium sp. TaxID=1720 RepID=UPI0025BA91DB|nr:glycosyltransferase [Corynebacterium sp.]